MGMAITGWGSALPPTRLDNARLGMDLGLDPEWISQRTGISSRRVVSWPGEGSASLAASACSSALERAELDPMDVDLVVVATMTPDVQTPATASLVQAWIGADRAGAFDLNAACSGFVYALSVVNSILEAGHAERVLVCGADVMSRVTDYSDPKSCVLFGDGAGALVIERADDVRGLGHFVLGSDGSKADLLHIPRDGCFIQMKGPEVYRHAVDAMVRAITQVAASAALDLKEIDLVVAHQANGRILDAVAARLGITSGQLFVNIGELGNTSAASIPLALAEAADTGRLTGGEIVAVAAFGAGFTWGAGLLRWGTDVVARTAVQTAASTTVPTDKSEAALV